MDAQASPKATTFQAAPESASSNLGSSDPRTSPTPDRDATIDQEALVLLRNFPSEEEWKAFASKHGLILVGYKDGVEITQPNIAILASSLVNIPINPKTGNYSITQSMYPGVDIRAYGELYVKSKNKIQYTSIHKTASGQFIVDALE